MKKYLLSFVLGCSVLSLRAPDDFDNTITIQKGEQGSEGEGLKNPFDGPLDKLSPHTPIASSDVLHELLRQSQLQLQAQKGGNNGVTFVPDRTGTASVTPDGDKIVGDALENDAAPTVVVNPSDVVQVQAPIDPFEVMRVKLERLSDVLDISNKTDQRIAFEDALNSLGKFPEAFQGPIKSLLENLSLILKGENLKDNIVAARNALNELPEIEQLKAFDKAIRDFLKKKNPVQKKITISNDAPQENKGNLLEFNYVDVNDFEKWLLEANKDNTFEKATLQGVLEIIKIPDTSKHSEYAEDSNYDVLDQASILKTSLSTLTSVEEKLKNPGEKSGRPVVDRIVKFGVNKDQVALLKKFIQVQIKQLQDIFLKTFKNQNIQELLATEKGETELGLQQNIILELFDNNDSLLNQIQMAKLEYKVKMKKVLGEDDFFDLLKMLGDNNPAGEKLFKEVATNFKVPYLTKLAVRLMKDFRVQDKIRDSAVYRRNLAEAFEKIMQLASEGHSYSKTFADFLNENNAKLSMSDLQQAIPIAETFSGKKIDGDQFDTNVQNALDVLFNSYENPLINEFAQEEAVFFLQDLAAKDSKRSKFIKQMLSDYESVKTLQQKIEDIKNNPNASVDAALELADQMNKLFNTIGLRKWYLGDRKTYNNLQEMFTAKIQQRMQANINALSKLPFNLLIGAKQRNYAWGIPVLKVIAKQFREEITVGDAFKALFLNGGVHHGGLDRTSLYDDAKKQVTAYTENLKDVTETLAEINNTGFKLPMYPSARDLKARLDLLENGVELINKTRNQIKALQALEKVGKDFDTETFLNKNALQTLKIFVGNMENNPSFVPDFSDNPTLEWINPTQRENFYYLCASPATRPFAFSIARSALAGKVTLPVEAIARAKEILENQEINEALMKFNASRSRWLEADQKEIEELRKSLAAIGS